MIAPSPSDGSRHLMLPSQLPEVAQYEALRSLLERRLDMQIKDLRVLLLLPIKELDLDAGCNFAAAAVISTFWPASRFVSWTPIRPFSISAPIAARGSRTY
jgi:hypothetical protein